MHTLCLLFGGHSSEFIQIRDIHVQSRDNDEFTEPMGVADEMMN